MHHMFYVQLPHRNKAHIGRIDRSRQLGPEIVYRMMLELLRVFRFGLVRFELGRSELVLHSMLPILSLMSV